MDKIKTKVCVDCKKEYPATTEYFYRKGKKLQVRCKKCDNIKRSNNMKKEKEKSNKRRLVLTEKQEEVFTKKAQELNMSRAEFLQLIISKAEAEPLIKIEPKCFDVFNSQIMGIATNINQIAHICNATQSVYKDDVDKLREAFKEIRHWQRELEAHFNMIDTSIKYASKVILFDDI